MEANKEKIAKNVKKVAKIAVPSILGIVAGACLLKYSANGTCGKQAQSLAEKFLNTKRG